MANVRPMLLGMMARFGRDPAITAQARANLTAWLADHTAVAPDLVGATLRISALSGDAALFDELLTAARKTPERRERALLLGSLGAFLDPQLNQRALALILSKEFDRRDTLSILQQALSVRETREAAWTFLQQHFEEIVPGMREDERLQLFSAAPAVFCDPAHRQQIESVLTPRAAEHAGAPQALANGLGTARTCETALARNRAAITAFLAKY